MISRRTPRENLGALSDHYFLIEDSAQTKMMDEKTQPPVKKISEDKKISSLSISPGLTRTATPNNIQISQRAVMVKTVPINSTLILFSMIFNPFKEKGFAIHQRLIGC